MDRKSWRVWILVALAAALIMAVDIAGAEGGRTLKTKMPVPIRTRGINFDGPNTVETCVESTWTITKAGFAEAGCYYEYTIAIDDGSHPNGYYDTQYASARTTSSSFRYTFYQPGQYCLFAYKYADADSEESSDSITQLITVTEGSGENALMNAVAEAAAECRMGNDFRTVEEINRYLCDLIKYDDTYTYYSPEAALLNGTGVCNSYSRAFELIATACNLPCKRVTGTARGGGHAWNLVKMDGKWYQMDLTWNDTGGDRHLYFGLTDTLIGHDHSNMYIVGGDSIVCDAMDDNWFIYTGEWDTRLARSTKGDIQASIDAGATLIEQTLDMIYVDTTSNSYYPKHDKFWLYGNILAYGYSQKIWAGPNGTLLKGPFVYDFDSSTLSATLSAVSYEFRIDLPRNLTRIESEAFLNVAAEEIDIPDSVTFIGENAFPSGVTLIVGSGSYAYEWAGENGFTPTVR